MEYVIVAIVIVALGYHFFGKKDSLLESRPKSKPTATPSTTPSVTELKKLTKVQLLDIADKGNIKVKRGGSKAEVIKSLSKLK